MMNQHLQNTSNMMNQHLQNTSNMMNQHIQNTTNTSIRSVTDNQLQGGGHLPLYGLVLYVLFACLALTLSVISFVAIKRTKKTSYSTKVLSMCLLVFDSLFLISSSMARFVDHKDAYIIQHTSRGFHVSSYIIVGCMALERLLVLNWTYFYHRYNTEKRIRIICICISLGAFLHYAIVRICACYIARSPLDCGIGLQAYFLAITIVVSILSLISDAKIYSIVRQKTTEQKCKYQLTHYKGTLVSFMYLVNVTINLIVYLGLAVAHVIRANQGATEDGFLAIPADSANVVNCIVDPLIYVILFKETRLEILKMIKVVFPSVEPTITKMHMEIFNIVTNYTNNSDSQRPDYSNSKDTSL